MRPRYPVFVPSKGRHESCLTMKSLEKIGVPYTAVVEADEATLYERAVARIGSRGTVLVMPQHDRGLVVTRNWIWDHVRDRIGTERFWTIDDNVTGFYRFNRNLKTPVASGTVFYAAEAFVERYENVPIAGFQYFMFASRKEGAIPPFYLNTRVYSNMLIETDARDSDGEPFRNEGFFNDDTDLCLRVLKDGHCTVLFNAFLLCKSTTMTVRGGMTPHYQDAGTGRKEDDGRWKMAEELRQKHPDVTTITKKWGRWQHQVDYSPFRRNRLRRRPEVDVPAGVDNFGMYLQERIGDRWVRADRGGGAEVQG